MESKTIAFVDCCGYSAYTDEHGDAAGVEVYLGMRRRTSRRQRPPGSRPRRR